MKKRALAMLSALPLLSALSLAPARALAEPGGGGPTGGVHPVAAALQPPQPAPRGTVYVANEGTGTVSVVDAATGQISATICLGSDPAVPGTPQPAGPCNTETQHHGAFFNGHVDAHGLWLTPDGAILLVTNRISGTVVAVDTATNAVLGYASTGREPHLATVRPGTAGGAEAWVAVRGEDYVDVLSLDRAALHDPSRRRTERMDLLTRVGTVRGPSMVSFTSDGRWAFVAAGKETRVDKVDATARQVVASQTVPAPFSPFGLVTPDDGELYLVHKGAGQLSILRTDDLGFLVQGLPVGPRANHVFFVGDLAYVTVGGPAPGGDDPDPEGKLVVIDRRTRAVVHEHTGPTWTGEPHGIWGTPDHRRLFIGHESGGRVTMLDIGDPNDPRDDTVAGTVGGPAEHLSFLKKPIDIVTRP